MLTQDGLVPSLQPEEASGLISGSEQILKNHANKVSLNANDLKILIEDILHNSNFNAEDVDTDMLKRFAASIDSGDLEIISMHQEGSGNQKLELFKRILVCYIVYKYDIVYDMIQNIVYHIVYNIIYDIVCNGIIPKQPAN